MREAPDIAEHHGPLRSGMDDTAHGTSERLETADEAILSTRLCRALRIVNAAGAASSERSEFRFILLAQLSFRVTDVIGRRKNEARRFDIDTNNRLHQFGIALPAGKCGKELSEFRRASGEHAGAPAQPHRFARQHVEEIDLDHGPPGDVRYRAGRADMPEDQLCIIEQDESALWRQVG